MRGLVQQKDWAATPLGRAEDWSPSLALCVSIILSSGYPMAIRWGAELTMIYNDGYSCILGDKHPAALGRPLREVWPENYAEVGPINHAILVGERGAFYEEDIALTIRRYRDRDEEAHFTISYSPIPDPHAATGIGGILVTCNETTDRVRAERSLRELNQDLEAAVRQRTLERDRIWQVSEDLLGVSDFAGYFLSVNPAWTTLLGWREDEIRRMHVSELRHPDDAEHSMAGRARLAQGVPTVRMENRFRHKDGSWRWLHWTMTVEHGLIYVIGRHVTGEKAAAEALLQSERQFRLLVAGVVDHAMVMLTPDGTVSSWNAGAQRITGFAADEIVGQHFSRFYTAPDRQAGTPDKALAAARSAGSHEAEGWRVRRDGTLFWANAVLDSIRDERGELIGFAKITRDMTERRAAQSALLRAQSQLAHFQKIEALGQLTGGVAHDFNNMLMIVRGHAEALRSRVQDQRLLRSIDAIELAATRGETLTRQLLAFSRAQILNPVALRLKEHIETIRDVLASSARGDIRLAIEIPHEIWPVAVDVGEFELALVNLVVNARDAMPQGGAISITAENAVLGAEDNPDRCEGEFVALRVRDTGTGIPEDVLPRVFEPFFTTKSVDKGTGLGLSQVYGFSRQSGGTTVIDSTPGAGTAVTLYLPRSAGAVAEAAQDEPPAAAMQGSESILLVEDNPGVREVTQTLLEQLGYRAIAAASAAEALDTLASGARVDLVFSDIVMPGRIDGIGLARHVARNYPGVAVLLSTGYSRQADTIEREFPILHKPYHSDVLGQALRDALMRKREMFGAPQRLASKGWRAWIRSER